MKHRAVWYPATAVLTLFHLSCGGGASSPSSPTVFTPTSQTTGSNPASPTPTTTTTLPGAPTTVPTTPTTLPGGSIAAVSCPLGMGTPRAACDRSAPQLLGDVEAAIDKVILEQPKLFDKTRTIGEGLYYVNDPTAYQAAVVSALQAKGHCAVVEGDKVQVKSSNDFSEEYAIILSNGHIRRGDGAYRSTCSPAAFPLSIEDQIAKVRVAFFGIKCSDDRVPPRNGEGLLPVGCTGFITATPKNSTDDDVPPGVHGNDIKWTLVDGGENVDIGDDPASTFNKVARGIQPGDWTICADILGLGIPVGGCLHAKTIE